MKLGKRKDKGKAINGRITLMKLNAKRVQELPREMWKILPGGVPYYVICQDDQPVVNKLEYQKTYSAVL